MDDTQRRLKNRSLARDIGAIPDPVSLERREEARVSQQAFNEHYLPGWFYLGYGEHHYRLIDRMEAVFHHGGKFAMAMPRGGGKTTHTMAGILRALLFNIRSYFCVVGAEGKHALNILGDIRNELLTNEKIHEDFPRETWVIKHLAGRHHNAASSLLYEGNPIYLQWEKGRVKMPQIPGSMCSGSIIYSAGITSGIRGEKTATHDGRIMRPDYVVIDDPQTNESAKSFTQCDDRENIIKRDIVPLCGPDKEAAIIMPCTVIRADDLADRMLDRDRNPDWYGEKTPMLKSMPDNIDLWQEYDRLRREGMKNSTGSDMGLDKSLAFYEKNRAKMDKGAEPTHKERFFGRQISAIQCAMDYWLEDPVKFAAEYQQEPQSINDGEGNLERKDVEGQVIDVKKGVVPSWCDMLTAFLDVHDDLIYWVVTAWQMDTFTGHVVDYGTHPEQKRFMFAQGSKDVFRLTKKHRGTGKDGAIQKGLMLTMQELIERKFRVQDGSELSIERMHCDSGYVQDIVYQCAHEIDSRMIYPDRGIAVKATGRKITEVKRDKSKRERVGDEWRERRIDKYKGVREIQHDANHWKTFIRNRLLTARGDPGALTICKRNNDLFINHVLSESSQVVEAGGRAVHEWSNPPGKDNHWFDCLVGSAVAASCAGVRAAWADKRDNQKKSVQYVSNDILKAIGGR